MLVLTTIGRALANGAGSGAMPTTRPGRWVKPEARSLLGGRRPGSPRFPERAREQGAATPASPLGEGGDAERRDDAARAWPRLGSRTLAFVAACVVLAAVALALARFAPGGLAVSLPTWDADASADASREKTPSTEARERPSRDVVPSRLSAEEDPAPTAPRAWTIAPRGLAMREGPMAKREAHRSERLHARAVVPAELDPPEARVGSGDRRMSGNGSGNHHRRETTADVDAKAKAKEAPRATVAVAAERKKLSASRRAFERTAPSTRSLDAKPRATSRDAARNPPRAPEESTVPPKRVERRLSSSRTNRRGAKPRSAPDAHHREGDRDHHRRVASRERTRTRVVAERVHEGGSPAGRLRAATRKAPKEEDIHARGRKPFVLAELGASLASAEATAELSRRGEASGRDLGAALVADIAASATAAAIASRREALLAGDPLDGGDDALLSSSTAADADAAREARAAARARRSEVPREAALGAEDRAGEAAAFGMDDADAFLVRAATNPEAMV